MRRPRSRRVENRTWIAGALVVAAVVIYAAEHAYVWRSPEKAVAYTYYRPWLGQNPKDMTLGLQVGFGSPTDPWGRSWLVREPDRLLIDDVYSAGPDRLDENGVGDDVFIPPYDPHELGIAYLLVHARYVLTPFACVAAWLLLWWGASRLEART